MEQLTSAVTDKWFLFDVRLLNHRPGSHYQAIQDTRFEYKGYVQQELAVLGIEPNFSWGTPEPGSNL
nr:hypothetical protein [Vibrio diabolicus]